jgi:hypothetical protein
MRFIYLFPIKKNKLFIALFLSAITYFPAFSQLGEGHFIYSNEQLSFEFDLIDNGWTIEKTLLKNKLNGAEETGAGEWFKVNMNGMEPDYNGPDGWFEFSSPNCAYTFTLNIDSDTLYLKNECSNSQFPSENILIRERDTEIIDEPDSDFVTMGDESVDENMEEMTSEFNISTLSDLYVAMVTKSQFENDFMSGQVQVSGPEFLIKFDASTNEAKGFTPSEALAFTVKMTSWGPDNDPVFPTLELTNVGLAIFPQPKDAAISWAVRYSGIGFFELYEPYSEEVFYILAPQAGD